MARELTTRRQAVYDAFRAYADDIESICRDKDVEIAMLQAERASYPASRSTDDEQTLAAEPLVTRPVTNELLAIRQELQLKHRQWSQLRARYDRNRTLCRQWMQYAENLERKVARLEAVRQSVAAPDGNARSRLNVVPPTQPIEAIDRSFEKPDTPDLSDVALDDALQSDLIGGSRSQDLDAVANAHERPPSERRSSCDVGPQATEDQLLSRGPLSDEQPPQSLERKIVFSSQATASDNDSDPAPVDGTVPQNSERVEDTRRLGFQAHIKREPSSSPVRIVDNGVTVPREASLDLDEVGSRFDTPRKRRKYSHLPHDSALRSRSMNKLREQRSTSLPMDENLQLRSIEPASRRQSFTIMEEPASDPVMKGEDIADPHVEEVQAMKESHLSVRQRVLQPIENNKQHERHSPLITMADSGKRASKKRNVNVFAEDGDSIQERMRRNAKNQLEPRPHHSGDRLSALLHGTEPEHAALPTLTPLKAGTGGRKPRNRDEWAFSRLKAFDAESNHKARSNSPDRTPIRHGLPNASRYVGLPTPDTVLKKGDPATPLLETPTVRVKLEKHSPRRQEEPTPIRKKPLSALRLDDFKMNPNASPRLNNASFRGREERRHLPGCTDPNCPQGCGQALRALAMELDPILPKSFLDRGDSNSDDSNIDVDDADRLLRWHLGATYYGPSIARLDPEERQELLLQAKTKLLAERHGRHRVQVTRQRSPPGFWRTEMPSTQELERDREEARRLEKEKVQERWSEAMRDGGLWVFRDE